MSMTFHGIGVDTTTISRVRTVLERTPSTLNRLFSERELQDALSRGPEGSDPWVKYLAGAFAIKEAVAKAFGTGIREMAWSEISSARNHMGKPEVTLAGGATCLATKLDIGPIHVSLTSEGDTVTAFAIAETAEQPLVISDDE